MVKTNNFTNRYTILFELCTPFQKLVQKVVNKSIFEYGSILYNSTELSVGRTSREFQNQTVIFKKN